MYDCFLFMAYPRVLCAFAWRSITTPPPQQYVKRLFDQHQGVRQDLRD